MKKVFVATTPSAFVKPLSRASHCSVLATLLMFHQVEEGVLFLAAFMCVFAWVHLPTLYLPLQVFLKWSASSVNMLASTGRA